MDALEGLTIETEGDGDEVVVLLHGWPDTLRLWDRQVEVLRGDFRCVRMTLPGYDLDRPRRPTSIDAMTETFRALVERESPGRPVVLVLHDWGCVFGLHFAMKHPELVSRVVAMDVGDATSDAIRGELTLSGKLMVFGYQFWLALAWRIGGALGDRMTRFMAKRLGAPAPPEEIGAHMNYPYDMIWMRSYGSFAGLETWVPTKPTLFFWGARKPFQFFSRAWAASIEAREDSKVVRVESGHWVMTEQTEQVNAELQAWLKGPA
ncbi:MAG: alpha/beta hydrolase [Myxococcota bacterium]